MDQLEFKLRETELDMDYLVHWVRELQVEHEWTLARSRSSFSDFHVGVL